jgi:hypothetical protein
MGRPYSPVPDNRLHLELQRQPEWHFDDELRADHQLQDEPHARARGRDVHGLRRRCWLRNAHVGNPLSLGVDCATFAVSGFSGRGVVTSGTGDLTGLNGSIQFGEVTYDGDLH